MTWTKLSDDFSDDCWTLSDGAYRLHVEALNWSNRKLLDCKIPKSDVPRFARNGATAADELVAVGWWTDSGKDYLITHHASYQRLKAEVVKLQERNQRNGAKSNGRPPKPAREVWGSGNPSGLRDGMPDGNPKGQDRSGQDHQLGEVVQKQNNGWTKEQDDAWNSGGVGEVAPDCSCGKPLRSVMEQKRGMCNRCNTNALAAARRSA